MVFASALCKWKTRFAGGAGYLGTIRQLDRFGRDEFRKTTWTNQALRIGGRSHSYLSLKTGQINVVLASIEPEYERLSVGTAMTPLVTVVSFRKKTSKFFGVSSNAQMLP
jgi:hypothetical protein